MIPLGNLEMSFSLCPLTAFMMKRCWQTEKFRILPRHAYLSSQLIALQKGTRKPNIPVAGAREKALTAYRTSFYVHHKIKGQSKT